MSYYLSKSDFKVGHNCHTKLYYKKRYYPSQKELDDYLQHLAKGGYMVGKLATLLYPNGILIDTGIDHEEAIKKTKEYLELENVTLFEAAIESKGKLIRVDILEKLENRINLIEVKSKSYETTDDKKKINKLKGELEEYIVDVAFQYFVVKEAFPIYQITPFLFLPDKSKNTKVDGLNSLFEIKEAGIPNSRFKKYDVSFDIEHLNEILNDDVLTLVNIEKEVVELQPLIESEVNLFLNSLNGELKKITVPLNKDCFKCEYFLTDEIHSTSGFDECWKDFPKVEHHIRDLYYLGSIGGYKRPLANDLIAQKKISLEDFPIESLGDGVRAERQKVQIQYTLKNKEWINENLKHELNSLEYPLHFIDFETTMTALPFHVNMRPYEVVNFQWSCHTIKKAGEESIHSEWIYLEPTFPSFKFAESLMKTIGTDGTALMWSHYENTMLKTIYNQFDKYGYENPELKEWLEYMVKFDKYDEGKLVDMNRMAIKNYFHPAMKGKTSIKWTLPAVLKASKLPVIEDLLTNFEPGLSLLKKNDAGEITDPYQVLPSLDIYEKAEVIKDGTGAMRAYEDIMFGLRKGNSIELEKYRQALLRYCKLDSLAMVIIWEYWTN
jgi:hypothetical protein